MSTKPIRRITLFKVPKPEDQQALLDKYRTMPETAVKNGSPYILSVSAGPAFADQDRKDTLLLSSPFSQARRTWSTMMTKCEAHKSLKAVAKSVHQGAMMVYFESIFD